MTKEYDLIVLGGGPAGYPAAIRASQMGAGVCLVEKEKLGGVCLNWGCIPTKTLHALAHLVKQSSTGGEAGVEGKIIADAVSMKAHKQRVVEGLVSGVEKLLKGRKITVLKGKGTITAPGEVEVEGTGMVRGKRIIIASGSSEIELPGMEFDGRHILSSTDLLDIERIPASMIVVGGGVIGCEFASIFEAFGTKVTIIEMLPTLISTADIQVVRLLQSSFKKKGIDLRLSTRVVKMDVRNGSVAAVLENGDEVAAEVALVSVGRRPNTSGIGLENAGVSFDKAGIGVNAGMETNVGGIYAAGDVVGGWLLAHVATREGIVAAENALGRESLIDYSAVPATIYTLPEVAQVGMTEEEAAKGGFEVATGRFPFAANGKAKGLREDEGFVKWVASKNDGRLLGLHVIGPQATELIAAGILAVREGMTASRFASAIYPHPTLCEALCEAAEAVEGRAIHLLK